MSCHKHCIGYFLVLFGRGKGEEKESDTLECKGSIFEPH